MGTAFFLRILLLFVSVAGCAIATDTVELLRKPELTREEKAELASATVENDLNGIDRRTALKIIASTASSSAKLAIANLKAFDQKLTPAQLLPFIGVQYNACLDLDPMQPAMYFRRAAGFAQKGPPPTFFDDLRKAGWNITRADYDGFVDIYWHARGTPRPTLSYDIIADASATPPWTRTASASAADLLLAYQAPGVETIAPQCEAAIADPHLPLRTRILAYYLVQRAAMTQWGKRIGGSATMAQTTPMTFPPCVEVGRGLMYNAYLDRDYKTAIALLAEAAFHAKKPDDTVALLRKDGWDIQPPDITVMQEALLTMKLDQAAFAGQQIGFMADSMPDLTAAPPAPAPTGPAPATGPASATRAADF